MDKKLVLMVLMVSVLPAKAGPYREAYRPQYHFTADEGWINDPNGLVYVNGVYHLFFQHGKGIRRWGHAISADLLHWRQLPDAIEPLNGHPVFSGSAVVDEKNTSGFQVGTEPPVVAVFTSWGEGQCLAYSNDDGMTWTRYEGNPVLKLPGDETRSFPLSSRDPHVMWDETRNRWVMVLYVNPEQNEDKSGAGFSIFTSPDLRQWEKQSHLPGFYVCPDVFHLPVVDEPGQNVWVAMDWQQYATGAFDGMSFTPETEVRALDSGKNRSANQSWKHLPDGRVVQICWLRGGKYPGMPFDQQMGFPTELSLRRINGQLTLCKTPIDEIKRLYTNTTEFDLGNLNEGECLKVDAPGKSLDMGLQFNLGDSGELVINVLEQDITITRNEVRCRGCVGKLPGTPEVQDIRILADRTSLEIFANHGSMTMTFCLVPNDASPDITLRVEKGRVGFSECVVREVGSIWPGKPSGGTGEEGRKKEKTSG